ncbi:hypothetical protein EJ04DRAFT_45352 [Polyplosphaeria fusca]|uniref:Uncharacterized protein n=1 Tax=Polyplosphaeria fusca TaxID=682080 RepID=A0A9P4QRS9_9PLEO|nr:hypothetical protein EJ04DRAFT_45352 [Polyplosphaeria fusca]
MRPLAATQHPRTWEARQSRRARRLLSRGALAQGRRRDRVVTDSLAGPIGYNGQGSARLARSPHTRAGLQGKGGGLYAFGQDGGTRRAGEAFFFKGWVALRNSPLRRPLLGLRPPRRLVRKPQPPAAARECVPRAVVVVGTILVPPGLAWGVSVRIRRSRARLCHGSAAHIPSRAWRD